MRSRPSRTHKRTQGFNTPWRARPRGQGSKGRRRRGRTSRRAGKRCGGRGGAKGDVHRRVHKAVGAARPAGSRQDDRRAPQGNHRKNVQEECRRLRAAGPAMTLRRQATRRMAGRHGCTQCRCRSAGQIADGGAGGRRRGRVPACRVESTAACARSVLAKACRPRVRPAPARMLAPVPRSPPGPCCAHGANKEGSP